MADQNDPRDSDTTTTGATGIRPSDKYDDWNGTDVGGADVGGIGAMDPATEAGAKGGETRGRWPAGQEDLLPENSTGSTGAGNSHDGDNDTLDSMGANANNPD